MIVETKTTWHHFQVRFSEWYGGLSLFGWGVYVTLHPDMFTNPDAGRIYAGMVEIMPQPSWGLLAVLTGVSRLGALYVNGHHTRTPTIRLIASFFSAFVWTQVVLGFIQAGVANGGIWLCTMLICADIYSAFRAAGDVALISRLLRQKNEESSGGRSREAHS